MLTVEKFSLLSHHFAGIFSCCSVYIFLLNYIKYILVQIYIQLYAHILPPFYLFFSCKLHSSKHSAQKIVVRLLEL